MFCYYNTSFPLQMEVKINSIISKLFVFKKLDTLFDKNTIYWRLVWWYIYFRKSSFHQRILKLLYPLFLRRCKMPFLRRCNFSSPLITAYFIHNLKLNESFQLIPRAAYLCLWIPSQPACCQTSLWNRVHVSGETSTRVGAH